MYVYYCENNGNTLRYVITFTYYANGERGSTRKLTKSYVIRHLLTARFKLIAIFNVTTVHCVAWI